MRSDVRVPAEFMFTIRRIASERNLKPDDTPLQVKGVDVSGGGLSFIAEQELNINDIIAVHASPDRLRLEGVRATVVYRSMHLGAPRTLCHCRFIEIDFAKKERIVKYVFEQMRELKQKRSS